MERRTLLYLLTLGLLLLLGTFLRFEGLGVQSLWRDEFYTWHASRLDFADSLRWGPEVTNPPLYQLSIRAITADPRPTEAVLRFPAALCGSLTLAVVAWLGWHVGGRPIAISAAGLLALHPLHVQYSQEARAYSMLVLLSVLSMLFWQRLVHGRRIADFAGYVAATTLAVYSHYLAVLTIGAQILWWMLAEQRWHRDIKSIRVLLAPAVAGILCLPLVVRYLALKTDTFQGLTWIEPPGLSTAFAVLGSLTYGWVWVAVVLAPAVAIWALSAMGVGIRASAKSSNSLYGGRKDVCGLLLLWGLCAWFGLMAISWLFHPAMVERYALPAGVPFLLFPLAIAHRLDRRGPWLILAVFVILAVPHWTVRQYDPGFREMVQYLQQHTDPQDDLVVLTLDAAIHPGWEDSERLAFDYYPLKEVPVAELRLGPDNVTPVNEVLHDPRGMFMIVLSADPFAVLGAAGRTAVPIFFEDASYSQLSFPPYRLVRVAPRK